jgi:hypothetical protein
VERIQIEGRDFVPLRSLAALCCRVAFYCSLGFGMGAVAVIPWLAKTSIWQSARAEKMAENMMNEASRCEARMMIAEKTCPMALRVQRASRNVGGE